MLRFEVSFTGRVQGVYFRATARDIAQSYAVTGWVRNEPDGSVRLVVEGDEVELDRYLMALRAEKQSNIDAVHIERADATGEFTTFEIAR